MVHVETLQHNSLWSIHKGSFLIHGYTKTTLIEHHQRYAPQETPISFTEKYSNKAILSIFEKLFEFLLICTYWISNQKP